MGAMEKPELSELLRQEEKKVERERRASGKTVSEESIPGLKMDLGMDDDVEYMSFMDEFFGMDEKHEQEEARKNAWRNSLIDEAFPGISAGDRKELLHDMGISEGFKSRKKIEAEFKA